MQESQLNNLVINKLTKAQYESISSPSSTELYFITDDNGITSNEIYEALNLTTTQNAIAKYADTTGTLANSGVTIDNSNNISTAGNATVKNLYIFGNQTSNKTNRYFTSDSLDNIYASIAGITSLVIAKDEVRRGASASSVNLGTSSYPWANIYGTNIYGNGSNLTNLNASNLSSGTISFDRLPSMYWANNSITNTASYNTIPEVGSIKIGNGTTTTTSTKNVQLQYDENLEVLNFVFI